MLKNSGKTISNYKTKYLFTRKSYIGFGLAITFIFFDGVSQGMI